MFRIKASCLTLALLLMACHTEGLTTATRSRHSLASSSRTLLSQQATQQQQPLSSVLSRKRQLPSSSPTAPRIEQLQLYHSHFESDDSPVQEGVVNNRHSANDYWYNIRTLATSSILKDIRNPVMAVFGWSSVVSIVHFMLQRNGFTHLAAKLCVSSAAHSFLVSSLGLLLVFRTNSAYQRFNEGRKIWEQILSLSRNLSRLTSLYGREIGPPRRHRIRNLIAAYPYLLRHHIRTGCLCEDNDVDERYRLLLEEPTRQMVETRHEGDKQCGGCISSASTDTPPAPPKECWVDRRNLPWSLLTPGALQKVARARNRPLWICDRLGREICDIPYGDNFTNRERQHFLSQVEKLTDAIGKCERIHQTAVPLNYARHSLRSLTLWLLTLPFTLVKDLGFMTGPAAGVIAWLMFGIYQIGYSIEDPFQGSLRLSILCDRIREDVMGANISEDEEEIHNENRNSAYTIEQPSWIDDAAHNRLTTTPLPPVELLAQTLRVNAAKATTEAAAEAANSSPLFSMADYEAVEQ